MKNIRIYNASFSFLSFKAESDITIQLCDRAGSYIHRFGRLFHQYIVDQIARIESARLKFFFLNQDNIRADLYQNVKDSGNIEDLGKTIGKNIS